MVLSLQEVKNQKAKKKVFNLFSGFPREVGFPKRTLVTNEAQMFKLMNANNGINNVFISEYCFKIKDGKPDYSTAVVDKIFIDLDGKVNDREEKDPYKAHKDATKIHEWCVQNDYRHVILFSGRCYQVYILCEQTISFKSDAILNFLEELEKLLKVDIDRHARANLAQLVRFPNSWNPKGQRFCIALDDLKLKHDQIKQLAIRIRKQPIKVIGKKLLNLSKWDSPRTSSFGEREIYDVDDDKLKGLLDKVMNPKTLPMCIKKMLSDSEAGYEKRYLLIVYFKERGFPKNLTEAVLKKTLSPHKYYHCTQEEARNAGGMINYVYYRGNASGGYYMWSCDKMRRNNYCMKGCDRTHPVYK